MNEYFYFQPRNHRFFGNEERCPARISLKPQPEIGMGVAIGLGVAALGLGVYGAVSSAKSQGAAKNAQAKLANQAEVQQIANLNNQVAADQASIAASVQSKKTWEYVTVGAVVLVFIGGVVYVLKRRKS